MASFAGNQLRGMSNSGGFYRRCLFPSLLLHDVTRSSDVRHECLDLCTEGGLELPPVLRDKGAVCQPLMEREAAGRKGRRCFAAGCMRVVEARFRSMNEF